MREAVVQPLSFRVFSLVSNIHGVNESKKRKKMATSRTNCHHLKKMNGDRLVDLLMLAYKSCERWMGSQKSLHSISIMPDIASAKANFRGGRRMLFPLTNH